MTGILGKSWQKYLCANFIHQDHQRETDSRVCGAADWTSGYFLHLLQGWRQAGSPVPPPGSSRCVTNPRWLSIYRGEHKTVQGNHPPCSSTSPNYNYNSPNPPWSQATYTRPPTPGHLHQATYARPPTPSRQPPFFTPLHLTPPRGPTYTRPTPPHLVALPTHCRPPTPGHLHQASYTWPTLWPTLWPPHPTSWPYPHQAHPTPPRGHLHQASYTRPTPGLTLWQTTATHPMMPWPHIGP